MSDELGAPKIVDRGTFQAELDALRVREKAHTREADAIAAARRRVARPRWIKVVENAKVTLNLND